MFRFCYFHLFFTSNPAVFVGRRRYPSYATEWNKIIVSKLSVATDINNFEKFGEVVGPNFISDGGTDGFYPTLCRTTVTLTKQVIYR